MERKYILTDETTIVNGCTLHRIKAMRDFGDVCKDDLGGFVQSENNLFHNGAAWVYNNAMVYENAKVYDDAVVYDGAKVHGNAKVYNEANIYDNAVVSELADVYGHADVYGDAKVCGYANIYGNADVYGNAEIYDRANVYGNNVEVYGDAYICGNAEVSSMEDYIVFKNWWSSGRYFTWTRSNDKWRVGCFYGSGKELVAKAYKDSETSGREYQRIVEYVESIKKK